MMIHALALAATRPHVALRLSNNARPAGLSRSLRVPPHKPPARPNAARLVLVLPW